jgi:hypothetical protein
LEVKKTTKQILEWINILIKEFSKFVKIICTSTADAECRYLTHKEAEHKYMTYMNGRNMQIIYYRIKSTDGLADWRQKKVVLSWVFIIVINHHRNHNFVTSALMGSNKLRRRGMGVVINSPSRSYICFICCWPQHSGRRRAPIMALL